MPLSEEISLSEEVPLSMITADTGFDELPGYRPVSRLAVAALAAGVASSLVLFAPLAAMLPLFAIAIAVAAIVGIRRSEGRMVGRWPALGGLALAVGFSAQALSTALLDGLVARHRAVATATAWVDAVREGRFDDAIAVSSPLVMPPVNRDRQGEEQGVEARLDAFRELPEVKTVADCKTAAPRIDSREPDTDAWLVRVRFEGCNTADELLLSVAPRLVTRRGQIVEEWLVHRFALER